MCSFQKFKKRNILPEKLRHELISILMKDILTFIFMNIKRLSVLALMNFFLLTNTVITIKTVLHIITRNAYNS